MTETIPSYLNLKSKIQSDLKLKLSTFSWKNSYGNKNSEKNDWRTKFQIVHKVRWGDDLTSKLQEFLWTLS